MVAENLQFKYSHSATDYYPFGMEMPGRSFSSSNYRYGFNGKENDNEVKGDGNSLDFGARIYDCRLGKWLSVDPKQNLFSSWSPYNFSLDNPLYYIDEGGDIPYPVELKWINLKLFDWGKQTGWSNNNQEFGRRDNGHFHRGIDFNIRTTQKTKAEGINLLNLADGKVIDRGTYPGRGNYIVIRHSNGYISAFYHLKDKPVLKEGETIKEGQVIGQMGNTGGKYAIHGHLEIGKVDPDMPDNDAVNTFNSGSEALNPRKIIGKGLTGDGGDLQKIANGASSSNKPISTTNNSLVGADQNQSIIGPSPERTFGQKLQESSIPIVKTFGDFVRLFE